jgi:hypothetical protein
VAGGLQTQFRFQDLRLLHGTGTGITPDQVILNNLAARR